MGTDCVEKSTKRDGPFSAWLVKSKQPSSVLTYKRRYAEQSSESWRTWSRGNLIPWKSRKWHGNVSWEFAMYLSPPTHGISTRTPSFYRSRTIRSGTEQNWRPSKPSCGARKGHGVESGRQ